MNYFKALAMFTKNFNDFGKLERCDIIFKSQNVGLYICIGLTI